VSAGADVAGVFVGGAVTVPVYEGRDQCPDRILSAAVESRNEGFSLIGRTGDLAPMPSMLLCLWGEDDSGERLWDNYFSLYPGIQRHGDWITITDRGASIIHGRSDVTINRDVRMGTSELYRTAACCLTSSTRSVDLPLRDSHGFLQMFVVLTDGGARRHDPQRDPQPDRQPLLASSRVGQDRSGDPGSRARYR
jgi:acetoacetyl-CoA synthetase